MTREVLTLALEALKYSDTVFYPRTSIAIAAIERALAQPEQEQEHAEQMSRLGWQCFNCPACGSDGAIAFSKPTPAEYAMGYAEGFEDGCKPKPEQEPTGMLHIDRLDKWLDASLKERKQRTWVGLTDDEVAQAMYRADAIFTGPMQFKFAKEIEAKLKEKNT